MPVEHGAERESSATAAKRALEAPLVRVTVVEAAMLLCLKERVWRQGQASAGCGSGREALAVNLSITCASGSTDCQQQPETISFESAPLSTGRARRRPPTPPRDPAGRHCQMSSPTPQVSTGETARAAAPKPCMLRHAPSNLTFAPTTASSAPPRRDRDAHGLRQYPRRPHGECGGAVRPHH